MSDERTPEQAAADDALTKAIADNIVAYHGDHGMLGDYVVLWASTALDDDGIVTPAGLIPRDDSLPLHVQLGLLRYGEVRLEKRVWGD